MYISALVGPKRNVLLFPVTRPTRQKRCRLSKFYGLKKKKIALEKNKRFSSACVLEVYKIFPEISACPIAIPKYNIKKISK